MQRSFGRTLTLTETYAMSLSLSCAYHGVDFITPMPFHEAEIIESEGYT